MSTIRKNETAIARVRAVLTERGAQSNATLMVHTKLSKAQVQGAIRSLTLEGALESEGATVNRVHRLKGDTRPAASPTASPPKRKAAKQRATRAACNTREPASAPPPHGRTGHRPPVRRHRRARAPGGGSRRRACFHPRADAGARLRRLRPLRAELT